MYGRYQPFGTELVVGTEISEREAQALVAQGSAEWIQASEQPPQLETTSVQPGQTAMRPRPRPRKH